MNKTRYTVSFVPGYAPLGHRVILRYLDEESMDALLIEATEKGATMFEVEQEMTEVLKWEPSEVMARLHALLPGNPG
jgi:hypothetical protein